MIRIILIMSLWLIVDTYFFQAVKKVTDNYWVLGGYWVLEALLVAGLLYFMLSGKYNIPKYENVFRFLMGMLFLSFVPKLLSIPVLILEDAGRLFGMAYSWVASLFSGGSAGKPLFFPERRAFVSQIALGVAAIPFGGMVYGMLRGKYDFQVRKITLNIKDLPRAFNGFTITHLSDIHAGSFDNYKAVERGVQLANKQNSDIMLFTGDFVNNRASELTEWKNLFTSLKAPFGKYSILGNHDYGDYGKWSSLNAKAENLKQLKRIQHEMGFRLLLDEHVALEKAGESINLIGVENWGAGGFQKYGNLGKAMNGIEKDRFNILMTHDPSHWEAQVIPHPVKVDLTLSGHTHGMQFGIETPYFRWSPSKYFYRQWAGLYQKAGSYIYVNRGFGFHGFPGRVGILPEITVITLKKA